MSSDQLHRPRARRIRERWEVLFWYVDFLSLSPSLLSLLQSCVHTDPHILYSPRYTQLWPSSNPSEQSSVVSSSLSLRLFPPRRVFISLVSDANLASLFVPIFPPSSSTFSLPSSHQKVLIYGTIYTLTTSFFPKAIFILSLTIISFSLFSFSQIRLARPSPTLEEQSFLLAESEDGRLGAGGSEEGRSRPSSP